MTARSVGHDGRSMVSSAALFHLSPTHAHAPHTPISLPAAEMVPGRTDTQCLHRWQKVLNPGVHKGPWSKEVRRQDTAVTEAHMLLTQQDDTTCMISAWIHSCGPEFTSTEPSRAIHSVPPQEDAAIIKLVDKHGAKKWSRIAQELPGRIGKQCRERCVALVAGVECVRVCVCREVLFEERRESVEGPCLALRLPEGHGAHQATSNGCGNHLAPPPDGTTT